MTSMSSSGRGIRCTNTPVDEGKLSPKYLHVAVLVPYAAAALLAVVNNLLLVATVRIAGEASMSVGERSRTVR